MAQSVISTKRTAAPETHAPDIPHEVEKVLQGVERHLEAGKPHDALELVRRSKISSPWLTHVMGLCQLRLGNTAAAITAYRGLVLTNGVNLRTEIPAVFRLNFAAALLADGNVSGFYGAISGLRDEEHPALQRYRQAVQAWKATWPWWRRAFWTFVGPPSESFRPNFPLGELR